MEMVVFELGNVLNKKGFKHFQVFHNMINNVKRECEELIVRCAVECINNGLLQTHNLFHYFQKMLLKPSFSSGMCGERIIYIRQCMR